MTPKEKAKELFDKCFSYKWQSSTSARNYKITGLTRQAAKYYALIAVNEIMNLDYFSVEGRDYWQQVKEEINKL